MKKLIVLLLIIAMAAIMPAPAETGNKLPGAIPVSGTEALATDEPAAYTLSVVDQYGDPVVGAFVNFCTDDTCTPAVSDENGVITFEGEPAVYHLQILKLPEGYTFDENFEAYTEAAYGPMTIEVVRE